ncbi:MAG: glycoside hydrolase family 127 protein, partial [Bacteroidetes bacterium]
HGDRFFYPNPLESDGSHERKPWFDCSCCPTNVARFLPSLPGYIYAYDENGIFVNLYISNTSGFETVFGSIQIKMNTEYPWKGKVNMEVNPEMPGSFAMMLRIPGWAGESPLPGDLYHFADKAKSKPEIHINGKKQDYELTDGYALIKREWKKGDQIRLELPMEIRKIKANEKIAEDRGKLAVSRGPVVYCAEWIDNNGKARNIMVDSDVVFENRFKSEMIDGIEILEVEGYKVSLDDNDRLVKEKEKLLLIPYYSWAHRGNGEMLVWLPYVDSAANPVAPPTIASEAKVSASFVHDELLAIHDQVIPENSNDHSIPRFTFWNHKGTEEWVQYDFKEITPVSFLHVYWFDDGPNGGCRIPKSWKVLYMDDGKWKEVRKHGKYPVSKDGFNTIEISPIETTSIRLVIELQDGFSGGILEWKVE